MHKQQQGSNITMRKPAHLSMRDTTPLVTHTLSPPVGKPTTITLSCMAGSPLISSGTMSAQNSSSSTVSMAMSHCEAVREGSREAESRRVRVS